MKSLSIPNSSKFITLSFRLVSFNLSSFALKKPQSDNMLKITNDGRKLALDQRLIDPMLPDDPNSKVNACVDNIYRPHLRGRAEQHTHLAAPYLCKQLFFLCIGGGFMDKTQNSKVNACVDNIYRIWEEHADTKAAQLAFCDRRSGCPQPHGTSASALAGYKISQTSSWLGSLSPLGKVRMTGENWHSTRD